jgi:hypothetical protein
VWIPHGLGDNVVIWGLLYRSHLSAKNAERWGTLSISRTQNAGLAPFWYGNSFPAQPNTEVKGGGQECPPHTVLVDRDQPFVAKYGGDSRYAGSKSAPVKVKGSGGSTNP